MTDATASPQHVDDAKLLNLVRAGDSSAFSVLYLRHEKAARRLARDLVASPAGVDDVIAETFARVLDVLRRGGGPSDAFRPYLLTALRRVCDDRLDAQRAQGPSDVLQLPDPGAVFADAAVASAQPSLMLRAFLSLPERWGAILWHTEIEQSTAGEIAPLFGLSRNGVAALSRGAKEGLRQAYLRMHISGIAQQDCSPVAEQLGLFVRDELSGRDTIMVSEHLEGCSDCRAVCAELSGLHTVLRSQVAPAILGAAAASYLSVDGHDVDGHDAATGATGATGGTDVALVAHAGQPQALTEGTWNQGGAGSSRPSDTRARQASRQRRLFAAGAAVVPRSDRTGRLRAKPDVKHDSASASDSAGASAGGGRAARAGARGRAASATA